jgi:small-conductance mechanosensitive channel
MKMYGSVRKLAFTNPTLKSSYQSPLIPRLRPNLCCNAWKNSNPSIIAQIPAVMVDPTLEETFSLTGKVLAFLSRSVSNADKAVSLRKALSHSLDAFDVLFFVILGWTAVPIVQFIYNAFILPKLQDQPSPVLESSDDSDLSNIFRKTLAYQIVDHISQAARIGSVVYLANVCRVMLNVLGYTNTGPHFVFQLAKAAYTTWASRRLMIFKRYLIGMAVKAKNSKELGKAAVYDRILDVLIAVITILTVSDALGLEMGRGFNSLFAFGGIGTLVFSLASKDIATQLVSGLVISTSDRFYEGETITLGKIRNTSYIYLVLPH